jgi:sialate O-acetylesterase
MMKILLILLALLFIHGETWAISDPEIVVKLNGYWKFNIGDNIEWSEKDFDDSDWDKLYAPGTWEEQGYKEYDGYAWYRLKVEIRDLQCSDQLFLYLDRIDDVNEVYFNGVLIGRTGFFPPNYKTAYNRSVTYAIPAYLLTSKGENTIAVRIFDGEQDGGFVGNNLYLGYDRDNRMLSQDLAGTWKIGFNYTQACLLPSFDDSGWDNIIVPGDWESQGFSDYDGQACYRKAFKPDRKLADKKLYLVIGKIDDRDHVFLNGKLIGTTSDMYKTRLYNSHIDDWQIRRVYEIPEKYLNYDGENTIVIIVDDYYDRGGIYEGPVGLMTRDAYQYYLDKYEVSEFFPGYHFLRSLFY